MNKTWFKGELLDYYKQYGTQEHTDGRHVLIIPKRDEINLRNVCFPSLCTLESTQMVGVAKLLHSEIFNEYITSYMMLVFLMNVNTI